MRCPSPPPRARLPIVRQVPPPPPPFRVNSLKYGIWPFAFITISQKANITMQSVTLERVKASKQESEAAPGNRALNLP